MAQPIGQMINQIKQPISHGRGLKRTGDGRHIWPAHFARREYLQIEKLAKLDEIPQPHGFYVSCLPVKIQGASAGWCRAVAMVPAYVR